MTANRSPSSARSLGGQVLGDLVDRRRGAAGAVVGADPGVPAPVRRRWRRRRWPRVAVLARCLSLCSGIACPPRSGRGRRRRPRIAPDPSPPRIRRRASEQRRIAPSAASPSSASTRPSAPPPRARAGGAALARRARREPAAPSITAASRARASQRAVERGERRPRRPLVGVHAERELEPRGSPSSRCRKPRPARQRRSRCANGGGSTTTTCSKPARAAPASRASAAQSASTTPAPAARTRASPAAAAPSASRPETSASSPPPKRAGRAARSTSARRRTASAQSAEHRLAAGGERGDRRDPGGAAPIDLLAPGPARPPRAAARRRGRAPRSASWRRQNSASPIAAGDSGSRPGSAGRPRLRVELAEHDPRLDRAVPLVELELAPRRRAGPALGRRVERAVDAEGDPERAPAAAAEAEARVALALPHRPHVADAARPGPAAVTPGLPFPNGPRRASCSATSWPRLSPPTTASTPLGAHQRRPAAAWPRPRPANASRKASTRPASISSPAAARWPP